MSSLHFSRRYALAATVGLATTGCFDTGSDGSEPTYGNADARWPMLGRDRRNTNAIDASVPSGTFSPQTLFPASAGDRSSAPIWAAETAFLSRADTERHAGGAYALATDGSERWHAPYVVDYTTPSVYGETVLFSGNDSTAAVDLRSGTVHWRQDVGGSGKHKTHLKHDDLIAVGDGRRVLALDAYTGDVRWRSPKIGLVSGLATDGELLYANGWDGESGVFALDWESGDIIWRGETSGSLGYPVVADGTVLAMGDGTLHALDVTTGSSRWTFDVDPNAPTVPAVSPDGERVFVTDSASEKSRTYALAVTDGHQEWAVDAQSAVQPLVARDSLFLGLFSHVIRVSQSQQRVVDVARLPVWIESPFTLGPDGLMFTGYNVENGEYNHYVLTPDPNTSSSG